MRHCAATNMLSTDINSSVPHQIHAHEFLAVKKLAVRMPTRVTIRTTIGVALELSLYVHRPKDRDRAIARRALCGASTRCREPLARACGLWASDDQLRCVKPRKWAVCGGVR